MDEGLDAIDDVAGTPARAAVLGRIARDPFSWIVALWTAVGLLWLATNRRTGFFELDESGYVAISLRAAQTSSVRVVWWTIVDQGVHGPGQAVLAFVPMRLLGPDPRIVLVESVLLAAGTAVLACLAVRRLATRAAGTVAGTLVLLAPGVIEHSHLALTAMPATFFGVAALYALVRSRGLALVGWAAAAGVATGSMTLARSMTIGLVPAIGAMAVAYALAFRVPIAAAVRGAVAMAAAGLLTASWWWIIRWDDVGPYLFGGGSDDTVRHHDRFVKFDRHVLELGEHLGWIVPVVALVLLLALGPRRRTRAPREVAVDVGFALAAGLVVLSLGAGSWFVDGSGRLEAVDDAITWRWSLVAVLAAWWWWRTRRPWAVGEDEVDCEVAGTTPVWPIWVGVLVGLVALASSTAFGVGFVLPMVPWAVVAGVTDARRVLADRWWPVWWVPVVVAALAMAATVPGPGLQAGMTFCAEGATRSFCDIDSNESGLRWRQTSDELADRFAHALGVTREAGSADPRIALSNRDFGMNSNTVSLALQWRHRISMDVWSFLVGEGSVDDQLAAVVADADLVAVLADRYDVIELAGGSPEPSEVVDAVTAAGFRPCDRVAVPDGRVVEVFAAPDLPPAACGPMGAG